MNTVAMPLAMLSGVMLPMTFAPHWLRHIAAYNPFAWAVDGIRALFGGHMPTTSRSGRASASPRCWP